MQVVSQIKAKYIAILGPTAATFCILLCYGIAIYQGHVKPWLPMISWCYEIAPGSYISRFFMISSAVLLNINSVLVLSLLNSRAMFGGARVTDRYAYYMVTLGCIGLGMVGSISDKENNPVHSAAALVFFITFQAYNILVAARLWPTSVPYASKMIKTVSAAYGTIALAVFIYVSIARVPNFMLYSAFCEWTGTIAILAFNVSFVYEFGDDFVIDAIYNDKKDTDLEDSKKNTVVYDL
mmetsp:Transcript_5006/g.5440  ORF Transcript_5006/g.5440 Transcript_5006/m.5440 type:complete len:238 (+) Transcript_5006:96-809(+)